MKYRCKVDLDLFRFTEMGKPKIWYTDNEPTHCCSFDVNLFIYEKNTQYNDYEGYAGYVPENVVTIIGKSINSNYQRDHK